MKGEAVRVRTETRKRTSTVEKKLRLHCRSGLFTLKFHFSNHFVNDFKRFESLLLPNTGPFEHLSTFVKQLCIILSLAVFGENV